MTIKICYIDPVSSPEFIQPLANYLSPFKPNDCELEVVNLRPGLPWDNIEYHSFEALVTADLIKAIYQLSQENFDAIIIGCFYDLCLHEAREIAGDAIIIAPCQASLQICSTLANKASVVIANDKCREKMQNNINQYGYGGFVSSLVSADKTVQDFINKPDQSEQAIFTAAEKAVQQDHAEAIILGCSANMGMHQALQKQLGVPVIDPVLAAFEQAQHHAYLKQKHHWHTSNKGSLASPWKEQAESRQYFENAAASIGQRIKVS